MLYKWAIQDKFCPPPPPIEDVSATYVKSLKFHLLFCKIFLEIQSKKIKKCGFEGPCEFFMEISVKIKIFVQKTWKSRNIFYKKMSENQLKSNLLYRGRANFFFIERPNV